MTEIREILAKLQPMKSLRFDQVTRDPEAAMASTIFTGFGRKFHPRHEALDASLAIGFDAFLDAIAEASQDDRNRLAVWSVYMLSTVMLRSRRPNQQEGAERERIVKRLAEAWFTHPLALQALLLQIVVIRDRLAAQAKQKYTESLEPPEGWSRQLKTDPTLLALAEDDGG